MNDLHFDLEKIRASGKPLIFVDDRELKSETARNLFKLGAQLEPGRLEVADFVMSPRCACERKTSEDLEASVMDGRLFEQAKSLGENVPRPFFGVIGKEFQRLGEKAMRGAVISLIIDFGIPVMFFDNEEELAQFIYHVAEREQLKEHKEMRLRFGKKGFTLAQQQQFIVESLPLIGPMAAKSLLNHFGSVETTMRADEKKLQEVEGIGKEKAKEIRKVVTTKYDERGLGD